MNDFSFVLYLLHLDLKKKKKKMKSFKNVLRNYLGFSGGEKKNHTDDEVSKTHEKKLYVSNMVH